MKKRLADCMSRLLFCFAAGVLYWIWLHCTGLGIPCLFYLWTGFKCPGCGITRMCLALLSDYPEAARQYNLLLFYLLPVLALYGFVRMAWYIMKGTKMRGVYAELPVWVSVALLLAFGVYRNIVGC
ncbi:MAG: DUF2752 domain-containing protein [Lachnospiraceae bacterium]|nr:DUF2752 domain-containing protein [Lachnospiraceae bacterium]